MVHIPEAVLSSWPAFSLPETSPDPIVRLEGLRLTLPSSGGAVNILAGIDLVVTAGETVAVTGPSGSGKSTLLAVIGGLERPSGGRVQVAGRDYAGLGEDGLARFRRDHIGIVFQSFHLIPAMTALENVAVPLDLLGRRDALGAAREGLAAVGLDHRLHHYPAQLSGGEQQRVALARAVAAAPPLLLADEPTGNLDGTTGAQIIDLLFTRQARLGSTLILVTHDPALAARCSRIVSIADGRIVADRPALAPVTD
jgi:putative ABC transport system ATP-binding protein